MILLESQLYTSNPKLVSSLFTYLFDLEVSSKNGLIYISLSDLSDEAKLVIIKKDGMNNHLKLKLGSDYLTELSKKVELFNYKNNSKIIYEHPYVKLNKLVLFSVI